MSQSSKVVVSASDPSDKAAAAAAKAQAEAQAALAARARVLSYAQQKALLESLTKKPSTAAEKGMDGLPVRPGLGGRRRKTKKSKRRQRKTRRRHK